MYIRVIQLMFIVSLTLTAKLSIRESTLVKGQQANDKNDVFYTGGMLLMGFLWILGRTYAIQHIYKWSGKED